MASRGGPGWLTDRPTPIPTTEEGVKRVARHRVVQSFLDELASMGYDADFDDAAFLEIAMAAQNPSFGMRIVPSIIVELKQ